MSAEKNNKYLLLLGSNIESEPYENLDVDVISEGDELIDREDIEGRYDTVFLSAHGTHGYTRTSHKGEKPHKHLSYERQEMELIDDKELTANVITMLQGKTGAKNFYVLSCKCGAALDHLHRKKDKIEDGTAIFLFESSKYKSLEQKDAPRIQHALGSHNNGKAMLDVFCDNVLHNAGSFTMALKRNGELYAFKAASPKEPGKTTVKEHWQNHAVTSLIPHHTKEEQELLASIREKIQANIKEIETSKQSEKMQIAYKEDALMTSVWRKKEKRVDAWLEQGVNVNTANTKGISPLYFAVKKGSVPIVKRLLSHDAKVYQTDSEDIHPLHIACDQGNEEIVSLLLDADTSGINLAENEGKTALMAAAAEGYTKIVEMLLAKGAKLGLEKCDEYQSTALFLAAENGHHETVALLMKAGAKVNVFDINKDSPLIAAAKEGHGKVVDALIQGGADISYKNRGKTALDYSKLHNHKAVTILLEKAQQSDKSLHI